MTDSWISTTVGEVITLQRGFDITRASQHPGDIPVISSGGVSSFHDEAMSDGPGVVIGRKGTLGTAFYVAGPYWPHDTTLWVRDFHGNHPRFVYYFFKQLNVRGYDVGSANPSLNRNHVHPLPALWPRSLHEQKAIAEVLGTLDDKIAANAALARTARELARLEFARIPRERRAVSTLGRVLELKYGRALTAGSRREGNVAVVGSGGVVGSHDEALSPGPCVVIGRKGSVGTTHWISGPCYPIDTTFFVQPLANVSLIFCYFELSGIDLVNMNSDSAVPGLNRAEALALPILVPDEQSMRRATRQAMTLFALADGHVSENQTLVSLRDTLLPPLMSGRLRVKPAERQVEAVV